MNSEPTKPSEPQAATAAKLRAAVDDLYAQVQRETEVRRPRCEVSGRCCRFEEYGHRLYVTALELAVFAAGLAQRGIKGRDNPGGCPFQAGRLCTVHPLRPLGCRMFFCDSTSRQWQEEHYEQFHGKLKRLHEELGVPYAYMDWIAGLRAKDLSGSGPEESRA